VCGAVSSQAPAADTTGRTTSTTAPAVQGSSKRISVSGPGDEPVIRQRQRSQCAPLGRGQVARRAQDDVGRVRRETEAGGRLCRDHKWQDRLVGLLCKS
jgi:hypothetical protein